MVSSISHPPRHPFGNREAHEERQVRGPLRAYRVDRFEQEACAIFERAAVTVGALVARRREEFVDQIAVRGMQFEDLKACLAGAARRLAEGGDDLGDRRIVHGPQRGRAVAEGQRRRSDRLPGAVRGGQRLRALPGPRDRTLAPGVGDLNRRYSALRGDKDGDTRKPVALLVVPQSEAMLGDAAARFHVAGLDADDTGAADGTRGQVREMPIVGEAVLRRILAHRRHHDAIARLHRAQRQRAEQMRL